MKFSNKIAEEIKRCAKELSDDEIVTLYKKVKEKLDSQNKDEDQVLDGEKPGEEPMQSENNSLVPVIDNTPVSTESTDKSPETPAETTDENSGVTPDSKEEIDDSIDDILSSLGLDDDPTQETAPEKEQLQEKEASGDEDVVGDILKGLDLDTQPEEVEIPEVKEKTEVKVENKNQDDEFSLDKFKTAERGFQVNRKDKDLMSDEATGPKYEEPEKNPPRTDCRRPNGIRWNRGEDKDNDVNGDKDLK